MAPLPLTSRLGIPETPHPRGEVRPGETVQFQAAPMALPGLTPTHPHLAGTAPRGLEVATDPGGCFAVWEGELAPQEEGPTCYAVCGHRGAEEGAPRNLGLLVGFDWPLGTNCHAATRAQG